MSEVFEDAINEITTRNGRYVFKYLIPRRDFFALDMPAGAKPLRVQVQDGEPYLYVLAQSGNPPERRWFKVVTTLEEIEGEADYIDTCQVLGENGGVTIHLFEGRRVFH